MKLSLLAAASIAILTALFFTGLGISCAWGYFTEVADPETLVCLFISILYAAPCWLLGSALLFPLRKQIPSALFLGTATLTFISCFLLLGYTLFSAIGWMNGFLG